MDFVGFARMVRPAVVALREYRDGVHMTEFQRGLELFLREAAADAGNLLAGVEVEMDLSEVHKISPFFEIVVKEILSWVNGKIKT
jgi:hypothetical protein